MGINATLIDGIATWSGHLRGARFLFAGRGCEAPRETLRRLVTNGPESSWVRQVHGVEVAEASEGEAGEADALTSDRPHLALAVQTADCVPVLLSDGRRIAAVHAGWRGLRDDILERAFERFEDPADVRAAIGPHIGACCYEVGTDVAASMAGAVSSTVVIERSPRPHLDLGLAARLQIERRGGRTDAHVRTCTRCDTTLSSYRRDGARAGRNLAWIWLD